MAFLILGVGAGAVYAALALGLVLVHRASGVVNFAHGAVATAAAYLFVELGDAGMSVWASLSVAVVVTAAFGLALHLLVFRRLAGASVLAQVVGTVGLMITIQAAVVLRFGSGARAVDPILPAEPWRIAGAVVPSDRILLAAVVVAVAIALQWMLRRTRFGLASRAAADNPTATALAGWSPTMLAGASWAIAAALAALAGILAAPITTLSPATYTFLVVPALAAALVGGLSALGPTVAAALALGMAQSLLAGLQVDLDWLPRVGLRDGLPPLVLLVALVVRGRRLLPRRGLARGPGRLPSAGRAVARRHALAYAAAGTTAGACALLVAGAQLRLAFVSSLIAAVLCLSLVAATGYLGQISLAQMTFAGVAGFALGGLGTEAGIPFPLAPLLAAGLGALAGVAIAVPSRRAAGATVAVVTLAAAVAVEELAFKNPAVTAGFGATEIPDPSLGPLDLAVGGAGAAGYPRIEFALLVLVIAVLGALGVAALRRSDLGRRMLAVRSNPAAAAASGVDVGRAKVAGLALSGFVAGVGGCLLAYSEQQVSFTNYGVFASLAVLALACLGGVGRISGALVGGALAGGGLVFTLLDDAAGLGRYQLLATGLGVMAVVVAYPDGLASALARDRVHRRPRKEGAS